MAFQPVHLKSDEQRTIAEVRRYGFRANVAFGIPASISFRSVLMLRKLGLAISYFIAIIYVISILLPSLYCLQHGCRGPGEGDAFMPAFMLTPIGVIATAFSLSNSIQQIRRKQSWSWLFWPLAIIFAIVLLGAITLIAGVIYETAFHRFHH